jgi:hypothetical protein
MSITIYKLQGAISEFAFLRLELLPGFDGGAQARFGSVTVGYQSGTWLFERGIISDEGLILECPFINVGPFFFHSCRPHIRSIDV